jgi:hypothetical protein
MGFAARLPVGVQIASSVSLGAVGVQIPSGVRLGGLGISSKAGNPMEHRIAQREAENERQESS